MVIQAVAVASAIALAALLGISDAPNSTSALVSARTGSYPGIAAWSVTWHLVGGILAGSAVARTLVGMVHVHPQLLAPTLAAGCIASVCFTWATTHHGFPVSASVALVGGLAGAGMMAGGWRAVDWGGVSSFHLLGVFGVLLGILLAPLLGVLVAAMFSRSVRPAVYRMRRRSLGPIHAGVWFASAAVGLADGTNDGQKAMGILAAALYGAGAFSSTGVGITWWDKVLCATVLAAFTVIGGRRIVVTVSRGISEGSSTDDLAAEGASAAVIFAGALAGVPLSTSTVVASAKIGTGLTGRRRHIRWKGILEMLGIWAVTVPTCALIGAGLFGIWEITLR
ncbi:MAG: inorganic phosphate transporter [Acidimicrobiales bacterium]